MTSAATFYDDNGVIRLQGQLAGGGSILATSVTLTDAQIKALPTTGVQLLAAQGANTMIVPLLAWLHMTWVADYTNIAATAAIYFQYGANAGGLLGPFSESDGGQVSNLLADSASHYAIAAPTQYLAATQTVALGQLEDDPGPVNAALVFKATNAAAGNFTGGNVGNSLKITLPYFVASF
jgi:hypothetical protein